MNESGSDPFRFTTLAHAGRDLLGPVSDANIDALLARIPAGGDTSRVLDVGCGKGELLVRAIERLGGTGLGVEPNPAFAAEARSRSARRLPHGALRIVESDLAHAELPEQPFTLGICTGSLHAFGDWDAALEGIRRRVVQSGWAIMGPGYWKQAPEPEYLASLGGGEHEHRSLLATTAIARNAGWRVMACHESTLAEWDDYEDAYAARIREWCDVHPDDPDAKPFRERIEAWAEAYRRWGRETMGYALMLLRRE